MYHIYIYSYICYEHSKCRLKCTFFFTDKAIRQVQLLSLGCGCGASCVGRGGVGLGGAEWDFFKRGGLKKGPRGPGDHGHRQ